MVKTVVIAGGSGNIGRRLDSWLTLQGYQVFSLTRDRSRLSHDKSWIFWDPARQEIGDQYEVADYVINIAGAGIAEGRWTKRRKKLILDSRLKSTGLLISEAKRRGMKLKGFISASAIGYYGDGGEQLLSETSGVITKEFLSDVCVSWEAAAARANKISDQVTILRIGTVLAKENGALEKMSKTIPLGIANYLGSGRQSMSWIHMDDLCGIIQYAMEKSTNGIFNAVAPEVLSNKTFTDILRKTINRRALLLPAPALGIKLIFGEMARVVLNSSNVSAEKIISSGYRFLYPSLQDALAQIYE